MHTLVLVPDGVGVRNFVLGRFLERAIERGRATVLHQVPEDLLPTYQGQANARAEWTRFLPYDETPLSFTLRYSLSYAQMEWMATKSMRFHLTRPVRGSWRTRAAHRAARVAGRIAGFPRGIRGLDRWHSRVVSQLPVVAEYTALFRRVRPSVLFCSHQRPPVVLPPVLAAKACGIPTATFIFSWDNLTSKGRIAAPFDHYLVWSDLMRDELLRYYPDVSAGQVHVVGTPQFDPYGDESLLLSRHEFCAQLGADPSRQLICFSGNNVANGPEDPNHVRILMQFIRSGRIRGNPQVVLRPAPVDDGVRFDAVRRDFPELIYAPAAWVHTQPGSWDHVLPLPSDVGVLANLTYHSDLNINFGSTMTLDFAVHDRPVVNCAFDVVDPPALGIPLYDFCLQFDHYQPVAKLGACRFARTADQFADFVNAYLDNPALDREGRRRLVDLEVGGPPGSSAARIVDVLSRISIAAPAVRTVGQAI